MMIKMDPETVKVLRMLRAYRELQTGGIPKRTKQNQDQDCIGPTQLKHIAQSGYATTEEVAHMLGCDYCLRFFFRVYRAFGPKPPKPE